MTSKDFFTLTMIVSFFTTIVSLIVLVWTVTLPVAASLALTGLIAFLTSLFLAKVLIEAEKV